MKPEDLAQELATKGGFSVSGDLSSSPHSGFMVARAGTEHIVPGVASPSDIAQFRQQHASELTRPGYYMGGWADRGKTYLDVSQRFPTKESAAVQGAVHDQLAVYDARRKSAFDTPPILPFPDVKRLDVEAVPPSHWLENTGPHHEGAHRALLQQQQFGF